MGDWFPIRNYFLTSKASPDDAEIIVIVVVIIVISEAELVLHDDRIIAQTYLSSAVSRGFLGCNKLLMLRRQDNVLKLLGYGACIRNQCLGPPRRLWVGRRNPARRQQSVHSLMQMMSLMINPVEKRGVITA